MRNLIALLAALALPGAISAVTLTVESDRQTYAIGETITLTVLGDDTGETRQVYSIFGRLLYDASLTSFAGAIQNSGGSPWVVGPLESGDGFSDAFFQIPGSFEAVGAPNFPGVVSVVTLTADAPGIVDVTWGPFLSFFWITSAPGTSFTIVPEPGTAALLGLAFLGLAVWRRARPASVPQRPR